MNIGERIKKKRKELRWSQRELSNRMGYQNHSTITKIEAGKVDIPQSRIVQFAQVLGTTPAYLMGWEEKQKKNDTLADVVIRLRNDNDFFEIVSLLHTLDNEKLAGVKQVLSLLK